MHRYSVRTVDQPAAGADWSFVPSNGDRVKLLSITAKLTTAVAVATREVDLTVTDTQGNLIGLDRASASQVASLTYSYSWRPSDVSYGFTTGDTVVANSCPGFFLPPGTTVASSTGAIAAADQWSSVVAAFLVCDEWAWLKMEEALGQLTGTG